jgi:PAS domain S-box-containing protein
LPSPDPIQRALHENPDWAQRLLEHSGELLCVHDLQGRFVSVNRAAARTLGYSVDELRQIPLRDLFAAELRPQVDAYLAELQRSGEARGHATLMARTQERRILEYHSSLRTEGVPTPIARFTAYDITEKVRAGEQLRASRHQTRSALRQQAQSLHELTLFRALVDQSNDSIMVVEPESLRLLDVNERACLELGYSRAELLRMTVYDISPSFDEKMRARVLQQIRESGSAIIEREHRRKDGTTFPVEVNLREVHLDRTYGVAVSRDISARRRSEEELRQSAQRFRIALEGSPIKVFNQDRDLRYTWVYNTQEGWTEADYLGKTDEEIFDPEVAARLTGVKRAVLASGVGQRIEFSLNARGHDYYCDLTVEPLRNAAGDVIGVNCACLDVTHLREISEELRQAKEKLADEKLYLEQAIDTELGFGEIIGRSRALKEVMEKVAKVAPSSSTVLLLGETGTGKELVARAIHRMSRRRDRSFIKLNCAAIPTGLLESELFGHEKGAFTGSVAKKIGRLELADRGTIFLDEIGELPLEIQPKLLRVLQDHEFERLGGLQTIKVDFRLVAATNRNLLESVSERKFRSDLYYRLNVFPIHIPALRERREDIPLLVEHFVQKYAARMGKSVLSVPKQTMEALMQWDWPGNIRELENFVERSVILSPGSVLRAPLAELNP